MPFVSLLEESIAFAHRALASCDNVGQSDDWHDLSFLVDYLAFAVGRNLPSHPCREGCDFCCGRLFPVSFLEWQGISSFLEKNGRARHFRERAKAAGDSEGCPFLEGGSCQIYPVRPLVCRGYGFFAVMIEGGQSLLMCPSAGESLKSRIEEVAAVPLPMWEPYRRRLAELNRGKKVAPLPLWLSEEP